jgi:hypothetical protein
MTRQEKIEKFGKEVEEHYFKGLSFKEAFFKALEGHGIKMAILVLGLVAAMSSLGWSYDLGTAPFCTVDNWGNKACLYFTADAAQQACNAMSTCVGIGVN